MTYTENQNMKTQGENVRKNKLRKQSQNKSILLMPWNFSMPNSEELNFF